MGKIEERFDTYRDGRWGLNAARIVLQEAAIGAVTEHAAARPQDWQVLGVIVIRRHA